MAQLYTILANSRTITFVHAYHQEPHVKISVIVGILTLMNTVFVTNAVMDGFHIMILGIQVLVLLQKNVSNSPPEHVDQLVGDDDDDDDDDDEDEPTATTTDSFSVANSLVEAHHHQHKKKKHRFVIPRL